MITANGILLPDPDTFQVSLSDLDGDSNRDLSTGLLYRDRIAAGKRKLSCSWPPLDQDQTAAILNAVSPVFFNITYPDPQLGITTKEMYVGDRTAPMLQDNMWKGLKMDFIER